MRTLERREAKSNRIPDNRRAAARSRKGFTLPELLLVIGILAILAGVSFSALVKHRNDLRQTELDQRARAVFIAAQNQLTKLESTGVKADAAAYGGAELPGTPTDFAAVQAENAGAVAPNAYIAVKGAADTAAGNFMDGTSFSSGSSAENECYIVEYNKDTYAVYGAWYWEPDGKAFEKKSTFSKDFYAAGAGIFGTSDAAADLRTVKENRKKPSVGYYGGVASGKQMETAQADFTVSVNNGPRLELVIGQPASSLDGVISNGTFTIKISSATHKDNTAVYTLTAANGTVSASDGSNHASFSQITYDGNSYTFTLDSLEAGKHFADLFPAITAGDDLHISVTCSMTGTEKIYVPVTKDVETNSLFAGVRGSGSVSKVNAANGRHLQNLSPEISNLGYKKNGAGTSFDSVSPVTEARLTNDINWTETVYGSAEKPLSYDDASTAFGSSDAVHFYPIGNNIQSSRLVTVDGAGHKISNLHVTNYELSADKRYGYAGLFGYMSQDTGGNKVTIQNLTLVNPDIEPAANEPTGTGATTYAGSLAGWLTESTVTNCRAYLADADGTHSSDAATEAAYLSALYEGTEYEGTTQKTGVLAGSTYAGGLIGVAQAVTAENCSASVKVEAGTNAGGFIGTVSADSGAVNSITNCYAGGHTSDGSYSTTSYNVTSTGSKGSAGGFIGVPAGAAIEKSFSTCSASSATDGTNGPFAGTDPGTGVITETNIYAIGTTGSGTANAFGGTESAAVTGDESLSLSADATHSYDAAWRAAGSPAAQTAYPYRTWQNSFYGDWKTETESSVTPTFVYYEKYADGTYGLWSADQTSENKLNTLDNNKVIVSDGYAYLSGAATDQVTIGNYAYSWWPLGWYIKETATLTGTQATDINGKSAVLYCVPWDEFTHKDFQSFTGTSDYHEVNTAFYDCQQLTVNGTQTDVYYNPHFAKSIAVDAAAAKKNPDTVEIRTARQLYELGSSQNVSYGSPDYWSLDWNYRQTRDIDYKNYSAETYEQGAVSVPLKQEIIGYSSDYYAFYKTYDAGKYDTNGKLIGRNAVRNMTLPAGFSAACLFGYNSGTIKNLALEDISTDGNAVYAAPIYSNKGTIQNCEIIRPEIEATYASGLVTYNSGDIVSCDIQNPFLQGSISAGMIYQNNSGTISGCSIDNGNIVGGLYASGMIYRNTGSINNCSLGRPTVDANISSGFAEINATGASIQNCSVISPKVTGAQSAAGFADYNYASISGCQVYPQQTDGTFENEYDASGNISIDNYTNALIVAPVTASGMVTNNQGTISSSSVTACVVAGSVARDESGLVTGASVGNTTGIAAGFVNLNIGTVKTSYANCHTAGYSAMGFVYNANVGSVQYCYALGSVNATEGYCSGFCLYQNNANKNVLYCYAAISVKHCDSFDLSVGGVITTVENDDAITANFGPSKKNQDYYLNWSGNPTVKNSSDNSTALQLSDFEDRTIGTLKSNVSEAHAFDQKLAETTPFPFPGADGLPMYGDWPYAVSADFDKTKLSYYEVYSDGSVGFSINNTLRSDLAVASDGYALLLEKEYANSQMSDKKFADFMNEGHANGGRTYLSWQLKGNKTGNASTNGNSSDYYMRQISATPNKTIEAAGSTYYYRALPIKAMAENADTKLTDTLQMQVTFSDYDKTNKAYVESTYTFTPAFADLDTEDNVLSIRTPRQLCSLSLLYEDASNNMNSYTFSQDRDIDMSNTEDSTGFYRVPIGTADSPFSSTYNGNGHTVSSLKSVRTSGGADIGLFGYVSGGTISNLTITGGTASADSGNAGLLANTVTGKSVIKSCTVGADTLVEGNGATNIGGLIGLLESGEVRDCVSNASVTVTVGAANESVSAGGFAGKVSVSDKANAAVVSSCSATGNVVADTKAIDMNDMTGHVPAIGGFAGCIESKTYCTAAFSSCTSGGDVIVPTVLTRVNGADDSPITAPADAGGFVGKEIDYQRGIILSNLITIMKDTRIVNRNANQNGNLFFTWLFSNKFRLDSNARGFTNTKNTANISSLGQMTNNITGYPGFGDYYWDSTKKTTIWGTKDTVIKDSPNLYNYYVKQFLDNEDFQKILAGPNTYLFPTAISADSGYLQKVYKYIKQDNMFQLWGVRHYSSQQSDPVRIFWTEPVNGAIADSAAASGYFSLTDVDSNYGYYIACADVDNKGVFNLAKVETKKIQFNIHDGYYETYNGDLSSYYNMQNDNKAALSRSKSEEPGTITFTGCTFEKSDTKNAAYTVDLSSVGITSVAPTAAP